MKRLGKTTNGRDRSFPPSPRRQKCENLRESARRIYPAICLLLFTLTMLPFSMARILQFGVLGCLRPLQGGIKGSVCVDQIPTNATSLTKVERDIEKKSVPGIAWLATLEKFKAWWIRLTSSLCTRELRRYCKGSVRLPILTILLGWIAATGKTSCPGELPLKKLLWGNRKDV